MDVYSDAEIVELFLNGRSLGQKSAGEANGYTAMYELYYEPGELLVISYADEKECGCFALQTAESFRRLFPILGRGNPNPLFDFLHR